MIILATTWLSIILHTQNIFVQPAKKSLSNLYPFRRTHSKVRMPNVTIAAELLIRIYG